MGLGEERSGDAPLFQTTTKKWCRLWYRLYACCGFVGVVLVWCYRATHFPAAGGKGRWAWAGMLGAELWFGLYWLLTHSARWNQTYRSTFKESLLQRFGDRLPGVDIFVCTADPIIEPPTMVINTVLSVLAYDYPPEKLSVYLSDDGGSNLTFYALLEASRFARSWIPFCKKYKVEPRSPHAYFSQSSEPMEGTTTVEWMKIKEKGTGRRLGTGTWHKRLWYLDRTGLDKALASLVVDTPPEDSRRSVEDELLLHHQRKLYKEMEERINHTVDIGEISEEIHKTHKGFSQWTSEANSRNHQAIVQILVDGRDESDVDSEGCPLPTLVYMAREKRPQHPHNFKAGAMNALLRVSLEISNGPVILNVDCDMYSNNSKSVQDALCFFMDEDKGHEFAYVQFPQNFNNLTKNDLYAGSLRTINEVDFHGLDGNGGPLYVGSGCFHRRESLCGKKFSPTYKAELIGGKPQITEVSAYILEERSRGLAACTYEENSQWGKEVGLKYGCPVEDVITGLSIQCRGWKSIYYNPHWKAFLGLAPMTLSQALLQHKRWSEGDFQILLSKYCPFICGHGRIGLGLQMGYSIYCLWAPSSLPTLYYASDLWFIPFAFVIGAKFTCSLIESLWHGETLQGWWKEQRMWFFRRTTSYLFAFIDSVAKLLGINKLAFAITAKVADEEVSKRYEQEIMEFGSSSPMFIILSTIAILNLFCLVGGGTRLLMDGGVTSISSWFLQLLLCWCVVIINMPIFEALFFRNDSGRLPSSTIFTSALIVVLACLIPML
ncbi:cellulose synthase-like protein E6 isoform X1 [Iris pallida]|uniref:Cellulose synthase-like protein E6 isoform X1 n=1 Tax=Iris pallida TaxID=29817 RepID=A0AAX6HAS5_IRIPA|nr:cellulose synthase-like protein E6 isoform X1 [Iris pallida]